MVSEVFQVTGCILERSRALAKLDMIVTSQVVMRVGPYGAYVQLGEASKKQNPRRTTVPKACTEPAKAIQTWNFSLALQITYYGCKE